MDELQIEKGVLGMGAGAISAVQTRARSSLRLKYEAEAELIRRKLGSLEEIRVSLGLSQRKISQLLLVDPSAWTRWTKQGDAVPPHILRMLQWYLALNEKYPALDVGFWLANVGRTKSVDAVVDDQQARRLEDMSREIETLSGEVAALKQVREAVQAPVTTPTPTGSTAWIVLALGIGAIVGWLGASFLRAFA